MIKGICVGLVALLTSPLLTQGQAISTGTIAGSPFCPGAAVAVPYTVSGEGFTAGNIFTAQLSDAAGSFATPVNIGILASITDGSIAATLPFAQAAGTSYRIRVIASMPSANGSDNGADLSVSAISSPFTTHTKTWAGGTGNWDNPANWSPCGVPNGASNVIFNANSVATIPAGVSVNTLTVQMWGGAKLIISANATLNNNGAQQTGIQLADANTTLTNNGNINCGNFAPITVNGIALFGGSKLENNTGGIITINDITSTVANQGYGLTITGNSSFTNAGALLIGNSKAVSKVGLTLFSGQIMNEASGLIEVNRINILDAIQGNGTASFANFGSIKIGNIATVNQSGINITAGIQFINQPGGTIEINNVTTADGISVNAAGTSFSNSGSIKIGGLSPLGRTGIALFNTASFANNADGVIEIDNIKSTVVNEGRGIALSTTSSFTNAGSLKIGNSIALYRSCIFSGSGNFTNQTTGIIEVNRTTLLDGITGNGTGSFTNAGNIKIGNLAPLGQIGINLNSGFQFINQAGAFIEVNNVPIHPAINAGGAGTHFINSGTVKIGQQTTLSDGMVLGGGAKFTNQPDALVEIDNANGATSGCFSVFGSNSTFTNGGTLNIGKHMPFSRRGIDLASGGIFTNQANGVVSILSTTVNNADFRAAALTGANTQLNNAGKLIIRLTAAPVLAVHGLHISNSAVYNGSDGSTVDFFWRNNVK